MNKLDFSKFLDIDIMLSISNNFRQFLAIPSTRSSWQSNTKNHSKWNDVVIPNRYVGCGTDLYKGDKNEDRKR